MYTSLTRLKTDATIRRERRLAYTSGCSDIQKCILKPLQPIKTRLIPMSNSSISVTDGNKVMMTDSEGRFYCQDVQWGIAAAPDQTVQGDKMHASCVYSFSFNKWANRSTQVLYSQHGPISVKISCHSHKVKATGAASLPRETGLLLLPILFPIQQEQVHSGAIIWFAVCCLPSPLQCEVRATLPAETCHFHFSKATRGAGLYFLYATCCFRRGENFYCISFFLTTACCFLCSPNDLYGVTEPFGDL